MEIHLLEFETKDQQNAQLVVSAVDLKIVAWLSSELVALHKLVQEDFFIIETTLAYFPKTESQCMGTSLFVIKFSKIKISQMHFVIWNWVLIAAVLHSHLNDKFWSIDANDDNDENDENNYKTI